MKTGIIFWPFRSYFNETWSSESSGPQAWIQHLPVCFVTLWSFSRIRLFCSSCFPGMLMSITWTLRRNQRKTESLTPLRIHRDQEHWPNVAFSSHLADNSFVFAGSFIWGNHDHINTINCSISVLTDNHKRTMSLEKIEAYKMFVTSRINSRANNMGISYKLRSRGVDMVGEDPENQWQFLYHCASKQ